MSSDTYLKNWKSKNKDKVRAARQRYRDKNPIRVIWHRLRSRSKERGHTCGISYEDFEAWCLETSYHLLRGKTAESASIDRINPAIGYEKGNLQILTLRDNSIKQAAERDWKPIINTEQNPF